MEKKEHQCLWQSKCCFGFYLSMGCVLGSLLCFSVKYHANDHNYEPFRSHHSHRLPKDQGRNCSGLALPSTCTVRALVYLVKKKLVKFNK